MAWFKKDPSQPNGLGGYRGRGSRPTTDPELWVPGPEVPTLCGARLSDDGTYALKVTDQEYEEMYIMPAQAKLDQMQEIRDAIKSLPSMVVTGTPDEMAAAIQARIDTIEDLPTAKTMLAQVLPLVGKCIGLLRDLAMVRDDDFEEPQ